MYLHGHEGANPSLTLPTPALSGSTIPKVTVCMYIYSSISDYFFTKTIFTWSTLSLTASYSSSTMMISLAVGGTGQGSISFPYTMGTWDAVCAAVELVTGSTASVMYEALQKKVQIIVPTTTAFSPLTGYYSLMPSEALIPLQFKNLLVMTDLISADQFYFLYWGNM